MYLTCIFRYVPRGVVPLFIFFYGIFIDISWRKKYEIGASNNPHPKKEHKKKRKEKKRKEAKTNKKQNKTKQNETKQNKN